MRNRIINGAMMIDQRNAGASVTTSVLQSSTYTVDRWCYYNDVVSKRTIQQSSDAPAGFSKSLLVTVIATDTTGPQQYLRQSIEGLNMADLNWGTANAASVTLSFWVKSSVTGQMGGSIQNNGNNRSFPFAYTINSANTWEYKTVVVAGDTTGTWLATNGVGAHILFEHGVGYQKSAAGTWVAANTTSSTGSVNLCATNGATWYITGVQLEKGNNASPFEFRPYGTELALCQRYCLVYSNAADGNVRFFGFNYTAVLGLAQCYFPVVTRVAPTGITVSTASAFTFYQNGNPTAISAIGFDAASTKTADLTVTSTGLTVNGGCILAGQTSGNKIEFTGMEL
jgi:hypothetical protein